jgi:predicted GH43/DUF377 family glycosyl hydrolase
VLEDEGIFKMWFTYGGLDRADDPASVAMRTGYAQSADGRIWAVAGSPALDVGGAEWDITNAEAPCVLKDASLPDGDPRKFRMYYAGMSQESPESEDPEQETRMVSGIGLAFSPDGREFTRIAASESPYGQTGLVLGPNPVKLDEDIADFLHVGDPSVVVADGTYHLWYTSMGHKAGAEGVYAAIAYATSKDGIAWEKHGQVLMPDQAWETGRPEASVGRPSVAWTGKRFEMFYDALKDGDDNPSQNTSAGIGFAWSADGKTWSKSGEPALKWKRGKGETRGMLTGPHAMRDGDGYRLYYPAAEGDWDTMGINLATGRPDEDEN